MWRSPPLRPVKPITLSITCVLTWGCGGTQQDAERQPQSDSSTIATAPSAAGLTLKVQMTGLLLIVPPAADGGEVIVALPNHADHVAWFGFGMGLDSVDYAAKLCDTRPHASYARSKGICYVDLETWQLDPLGQGGTETTDTGQTLPADLMNVTTLSGGEHFVHRSDSGGRRATVFFRAGRPGNRCSLARWDMRRFDAQTGTPVPINQHLLVNRLDWEIGGQFPRKLFFTSKSGQRDSAALAGGSAGRIGVILAHIPTGELPSLPPEQAINVAQPDTAYHFAAYYDLLQTPAGQPLPPEPLRRSLPHGRKAVGLPHCNIQITRANFVPSPASLHTYGCVLARADGT